MAFVFTPGQIARRASLYHQLSSLLGAGVGLCRGLETIGRSRHGPFRKPLRELSRRLNEGETFGEAVYQMRGWIPEFDAALLEAGERSGRLDATLRMLGDYYDQQARLTRRLIIVLLYPVVLLHALIFIFPIDALVQLVQTFQIGPFLASKLRWVLPIYGLVFLVVFASQSNRAEVWRVSVERLGRMVPGLRSAWKDLALARLSLALEGLISAGVNIVQAWPAAARASGSPLLRREIDSWKHRLEAGETPAELVLQSAEFPPDFASQYQSAEMSGQLDGTLSRLHTHHSEEGNRKMVAAVVAFGVICYATMAIAVIYHVFSFYTGYYGGMLNGF